MPSISVKRLIRDPFGPYPEHQILSDHLSKKGVCLNLQSVSMECAGSPIGLDESEFIINAAEGSRLKNNCVHFYGKLEIESLDWISEQGRRWLEMDLCQRDREIHVQHALNGLTLGMLYGSMVSNSGLRITVWIQCEKNMQARFLVDPHPNSLVLCSKAKMYNIKSIDVATFEKSQNYLARYRLWALIDEIIKTDPHSTPVEHRTIDWLVDSYLTRFRGRDAFHRHIFDAERDNDVDEDGNTTKQRHLRHVPRAEVFGFFAAHAEWILAQQLASTSSAVRKVHIPSWISFCRKAKSARRAAKRNHLRWGLAYSVGSDTDDDDDDDIDLSQFGQTREFWQKKLKLATTSKKSKPVPEPPSYQTGSIVVNRQQPTFVYDSDFSEISTSSASDSASDGSASPSLVSKIPPYCMTAPRLPIGRFKWQCPGCDYAIDLLHLTAENTKGLSAELVSFLRSKTWRYRTQGRVDWAFEKMVSNHYYSHLSENGLQVVWYGRKCVVEQVR